MIIEYIDIIERCISYKFDGNILYSNFMGVKYKVDFNNCTDGIMINPPHFIFDAHKEDGVLSITLWKPVNTEWVEVPQEDFDINVCEEVFIEWKTQAEIEEEKNRPKEPTKEEILEQRINELELFILSQEGLI